METCKHPALPPESKHFTEKASHCGDCDCYCQVVDRGSHFPFWWTEEKPITPMLRRTLAALAIFEWTKWAEQDTASRGDLATKTCNQWHAWEDGKGWDAHIENALGDSQPPPV